MLETLLQQAYDEQSQIEQGLLMDLDLNADANGRHPILQVSRRKLLREKRFAI